MDWEKEGREPDYRFSLANERTFLAWMRTALALLAAAVIFHQFAVQVEPRWLRFAVSGIVAVASAVLAVGAFAHWRGNQIAMRHDRALPRSPLLAGIAAAMLMISALTAILLLLQ